MKYLFAFVAFVAFVAVFHLELVIAKEEVFNGHHQSDTKGMSSDAFLTNGEFS